VSQEQVIVLTKDMENKGVKGLKKGDRVTILTACPRARGCGLKVTCIGKNLFYGKVGEKFVLFDKKKDAISNEEDSSSRPYCTGPFTYNCSISIGLARRKKKVKEKKTFSDINILEVL